MVSRPDGSRCHSLYEIPGNGCRDVCLHRLGAAEPVIATLVSGLYRSLHQSGRADQLLLETVDPWRMLQFRGSLSLFINDLYDFLHSHQRFPDLLQRSSSG